MPFLTGISSSNGNGISGITIEDNGVPLSGLFTDLNFAGSGVTITNESNGRVTLTITGGSGSPGGTNGQIQFNNNGNFGGSTFTINGNILEGITNSSVNASLYNNFLLQTDQNNTLPAEITFNTQPGSIISNVSYNSLINLSSPVDTFNITTFGNNNLNTINLSPFTNAVDLVVMGQNVFSILGGTNPSPSGYSGSTAIGVNVGTNGSCFQLTNSIILANNSFTSGPLAGYDIEDSVILGGSAFPSGESLGSSVVIGSNALSSAVNATGSIFIGNNVCPTYNGSVGLFENNIIIGQNAINDADNFSQCVVMGPNALGNTNSMFGVTAIGPNGIGSGSPPNITGTCFLGSTELGTGLAIPQLQGSGPIISGSLNLHDLFYGKNNTNSKIAKIGGDVAVGLNPVASLELAETSSVLLLNRLDATQESNLIVSPFFVDGMIWNNSTENTYKIKVPGQADSIALATVDTGVSVLKDNVSVEPNTTSFNFVGPNVLVTNPSPNEVDINITGGGTPFSPSWYFLSDQSATIYPQNPTPISTPTAFDITGTNIDVLIGSDTVNFTNFNASNFMGVTYIGLSSATYKIYIDSYIAPDPANVSGPTDSLGAVLLYNGSTLNANLFGSSINNTFGVQQKTFEYILTLSTNDTIIIGYINNTSNNFGCELSYPKLELIRIA